MARRVNCTGAEHIPASRPGLAYVDRWGPVQTYFVDKGLLVQNTAPILALTPVEQMVFTRAAQEGGRVTRERVMSWTGTTEWQARRWIESWALRGWIAKDVNAGNAFTCTPKLQVLLSNHPTPPTLSNRLDFSPTDLQPVSNLSNPD